MVHLVDDATRAVLAYADRIAVTVLADERSVVRSALRDAGRIEVAHLIDGAVVEITRIGERSAVLVTVLLDKRFTVGARLRDRGEIRRNRWIAERVRLRNLAIVACTVLGDLGHHGESRAATAGGRCILNDPAFVVETGLRDGGVCKVGAARLGHVTAQLVTDLADVGRAEVRRLRQRRAVVRTVLNDAGRNDITRSVEATSGVVESGLIDQRVVAGTCLADDRIVLRTELLDVREVVGSVLRNGKALQFGNPIGCALYGDAFIVASGLGDAGHADSQCQRVL